jgi:hypothetical protein
MKSALYLALPKRLPRQVLPRLVGAKRDSLKIDGVSCSSLFPTIIPLSYCAFGCQEYCMSPFLPSLSSRQAKPDRKKLVARPRTGWVSHTLPFFRGSLIATCSVGRSNQTGQAPYCLDFSAMVQTISQYNKADIWIAAKSSTGSTGSTGGDVPSVLPVPPVLGVLPVLPEPLVLPVPVVWLQPATP